MSRHGNVTLAWADGDYAFRLGWGELIHVQEACDAGPVEVMNRLGQGRWRVQDIEAPILHGLLGGGMTAERARALVRTWVRERPLAESISPAQAILAAAIIGDPKAEDESDTQPGKPEPADPMTCPPGGSGSPD